MTELQSIAQLLSQLPQWGVLVWVLILQSSAHKESTAYYRAQLELERCERTRTLNWFMEKASSE